MNGETLNDALKCWLSPNTNKKGLGEKKCRKKLIDSCNFMQCHQQCPPIYNPLSGEAVTTGEEVTFSLSSPSPLKFPEGEPKHLLELLNRVFHELQEG